jgi:hypothetical protein
MTPKKNPLAGTRGLTTTTTAVLIVQAAHGCPLARAACRSEDPAVDTAVLRFHPPSLCPAARRAAA